MYCVNYSQEKRRKYSYICHDTPYLFTDSFSAIKDLQFTLFHHRGPELSIFGAVKWAKLGTETEIFWTKSALRRHDHTANFDAEPLILWKFDQNNS